MQMMVSQQRDTAQPRPPRRGPGSMRRGLLSLVLLATPAMTAGSLLMIPAAAQAFQASGEQALAAECARLRIELERANAEISSLKRGDRGVRDDYRLRRRLADAEQLAKQLTAAEAELRRLRGPAPTAPIPASPKLEPGDAPGVLEARADVLSDQARRLSQQAAGIERAATQLQTRQTLRRRAGQVERDPFGSMDGSKRFIIVRGQTDTKGGNPTTLSGTPTPTGGAESATGSPGPTGGGGTGSSSPTSVAPPTAPPPTAPGMAPRADAPADAPAVRADPRFDADGGYQWPRSVVDTEQLRRGRAHDRQRDRFPGAAGSGHGRGAAPDRGRCRRPRQRGRAPAADRRGPHPPCPGSGSRGPRPAHPRPEALTVTGRLRASALFGDRPRHVLGWAPMRLRAVALLAAAVAALAESSTVARAENQLRYGLRLEGGGEYDSNPVRLEQVEGSGTAADVTAATALRLVSTLDLALLTGWRPPVLGGRRGRRQAVPRSRGPGRGSDGRR